MSAPVLVRSQFSDLYGSSMLPVLEEIFACELAMHPSRREILFKTVKHDRDIWQATEMHDMPLLSEIAEGSEYSFQRIKQGASKTLVMKKMGLGFSISREAIEDGKFDLIADMVKKLAKSARESKEVDAMNIFNNGFSTENTADGEDIFDTGHLLPSGLTFRNRLSSDADLSATSLETMLRDFETQFVGDSGIIYNLKPKHLVVHPDNKRYAMELIGSDLKADTAENNLNSFKGEGLVVVSSPHLTDADAWFLTSEAPETGLRIIERSPLRTELDESNGFVTDSKLYKVSYREQLGCTHPYGVFGTSGAG
jgi:phage major head subunit gpT-like protein